LAAILGLTTVADLVPAGTLRLIFFEDAAFAVPLVCCFIFYLPYELGLLIAVQF
jgi:hypothetical protein